MQIHDWNIIFKTFPRKLLGVDNHTLRDVCSEKLDIKVK